MTATKAKTPRTPAPDTNLQKAAQLEKKLAQLKAAFERKKAALLAEHPADVVRLVDT